MNIQYLILDIQEPFSKRKPRGSPRACTNGGPPKPLTQETPGCRFRNMNSPSDPLVTMIVPLSKNG